MLGAKTEIFGIFGHPVGHSRSPDMHNAAFRALEMNCIYTVFDIRPEIIKDAARAIRALSIRGVNITVPHKQAVMEEMDFLSPEAELAGAVNTVKNEDGRLLGYNTDIAGALTALKKSMGFAPEGKTALVIGAGGAARAVVSGLCMENAKTVLIANRTPERAAELGEYFAEKFPSIEFEHSELESGETGKFIRKADIVVNCSAAGMDGNGTLGLPLENFQGNFGVYDLVYKPQVTPLVKRARQLGIKAETGTDMLLYQGAKSFEIWTGKNAPVEAMKNALGSF